MEDHLKMFLRFFWRMMMLGEGCRAKRCQCCIESCIHALKRKAMFETRKISEKKLLGELDFWLFLRLIRQVRGEIKIL